MGGNVTEIDQQVLDDYLPVFVHGYCVAMLFANTRVATDEDGVIDVDPAWWQGPGLWGIDAFHPDDRDNIRAVCEAFVTANFALLTDPVVQESGWEAAGHDFALTRNGNGAGFWDRGYGDVGQRLTEAAHVYGESNAWITDPYSDTDTFAHLYSHDGE
jgi:hypothetical protein